MTTHVHSFTDKEITIINLDSDNKPTCFIDQYPQALIISFNNSLQLLATGNLEAAPNEHLCGTPGASAMLHTHACVVLLEGICNFNDTEFQCSYYSNAGTIVGAGTNGGLVNTV